MHKKLFVEQPSLVNRKGLILRHDNARPNVASQKCNSTPVHGSFDSHRECEISQQHLFSLTECAAQVLQPYHANRFNLYHRRDPDTKYHHLMKIAQDPVFD
ncbi:hypothetical protein WH47_01435 [Habropoda laboriosa]|uniref:Histone-lysine N-methyltransferase SETMAR n=1 Tax=Habropoda laboriosa TaxID=597456 RepID=A0A0L7R5A6_9HYME|nr:hypothetical protein WH47_01435 [Habropoda laboriosa]